MSRNPACEGCTWQLAPGVIDGPYSRKPARNQLAIAVGKALLAAAVLASLSITIGFTLGYFTGATP